MSKQIDVTVPDSETLSSEKSKRFTVRTVLCSSLCECVKLQQQLVCMVRTMLCSACHCLFVNENKQFDIDHVRIHLLNLLANVGRYCEKQRGLQSRSAMRKLGNHEEKGPF